MKNKDLRRSLVLAGIGVVSGLFLASLQLSQLDDAMRTAAVSQLGSENMVIAIAAVQVGLLTAIASFFGLKLARRTNLRLAWLPPKQAWTAIGGIGLAVALVIGLSDRLIFATYLPPEVLAYEFSLSYFLSSVLYGGIIEEVLLRLFMMSLLVFLLAKVFLRTHSQGDQVSERTIPDYFYIIAIFISALLFAAGYLPATAQLLGLSVPIVIRAFMLNGLAGLGFGYLYWKHGLGSAMAAHILTHVLLQLAILPIIA